MADKKTLLKLIRRCQQSPSFFIDNFGKVKHPKLGIIPFKLFSYQRGALAEFKKNKYNIFKKCRQCFVEGSMVWTPNGPKPIETIQPGESVYSLNMKTGGLETVNVKERFDNGISDDCVEIRTKSGHKSVSTKDHKFLTYNGWTEAGDLTQNDQLVEVYEPVRYGSSDHSSDPILLGYLLTDGGCNQNNLYFSNSNWKYLLEFQKHYELRFGRRLRIKKTQSGFKPDSTINYCISSSYADSQKWLAQYGLRGPTGIKKKIPDKVFNWNNNDIALLLNRMFAGDGWYSGGHCNEVGIGQQSLVVLHQIKQLLSRFQISCKIYEATDKSVHKLRIFGTKNFSRFVEQIGIFGKKPRCEISKGSFFNYRKGDVKSVKPAEGSYNVYDLSVPPYHNYIVDGTVVHNCGASTLTGAYALWYAMFFSNKSILIVSKRDEDAMEFLDRNVKFVYDQLPDWMKDVWKVSKRNEHTLSLANGSTIRSLTSSPDTLRSNSGSLIIIDEAAFMQHMDTMWSGGWSCSAVDSLVSTSEGLVPIGSMGDYVGEKWQDLDLKVATDDGYQQATKYYVNGFSDTIKIKTEFGYEFEATANHRIRIIDECGNYVWKYMHELQEGDLAVLKPNTHVGCRQYFNEPETKDVFTFNEISELTPDLAEFLGYVVGDGSVSLKRPKRVVISFNYDEIDAVEILKKKIDNLFGLNCAIVKSKSTVDLTIRSARVVNFLIKNKLLSKTCALDAEIPLAIFKSDRSVVYAFLRGLFSSDGWNYEGQNGSVYLGIGSASKKLIDQTHQLLLSIGIVATRRLGVKTEGRYGKKPQYRLTICDLYNKKKFQELIGFNGAKKNWTTDKNTRSEKFEHDVLVKEYIDCALEVINSNDKRKWNLYRVRRVGRITKEFWSGLNMDYPELNNTRLSELLNRGFLFNKIKSFEKNSADTVDLSVPKNNTYITNGFVSHNTIQTGGSVIVISTTNGIGNWYWKTWTDAINGDNSFNPININWWNMDWTIEFVDELSGEKTKISPCDGIKECKTEKEKEKYGPYWSPWLEDQYRQLSTKGSDHKFRQEILAEFMGTGNTVLGRAALLAIQDMVEETEQQIKDGELTIKTLGAIDYVHPVTQEMEVLNFQEELLVWKPPYTKQRAEKTIAAAKEHGFLDQLASHDRRPHLYVIGADPSTGEADDFCALEVFDVDTHEQVAELRIKVLPKTFAKMIDYIGRWYNNAFVVCERTGIGHATCTELDQELSYPNLYRHKRQTANLKTKYNQIGYPTSNSTKAVLIKQLQDELGEDGYHIKSSRLYHELCIFIHLGKNRYGNEVGSGNTDDLVLATAFALVGIEDALYKDNLTLTPVHSMEVSPELFDKVVVGDRIGDMAKSGGKSALMPFNVSSEMYTGKVNKEHELAKFTNQIGGIPIVKDNQIPGYATKDTVTFKKHILRYFRK